ncbi:hypothetical protein Golomagni_06881 [Golovinomyces magnicellulatus]|nr:hypothetical protein Golomagni_06881 [Golovinomyces magnicellulatus]
MGHRCTPLAVNSANTFISRRTAPVASRSSLNCSPLNWLDALQIEAYLDLISIVSAAATLPSLVRLILQIMAELQRHKVFKVFHQEFAVEEHYNVTKELGQGAYSIVYAAVHTATNEGVAIKKLTNIFSKKILAKRALPYLYEELMETDLAAIIRSGQPLSNAHFQSFIYQILYRLKYIHSANMLHRDLKPSNILVNADYELKIADFSLAQGFSVNPEENARYMTEYIATR